TKTLFINHYSDLNYDTASKYGNDNSQALSVIIGSLINTEGMLDPMINPKPGLLTPYFLPLL
ncbi:MAG: hypothetical protein ACLFQK_06475, partial [Fibrobacterota bacterium]